MNRVRVIALIVLGIVTTLGLAGCTWVEPIDSAYSVSGQVVDSRDNSGSPGVSLAATGGASTTTTTDGNGTWTLTDLRGTVTITPTKTGWVFDPVNQVVTGARQGVEFRGTPQAETDYMGLAMGATWRYHVTRQYPVQLEDGQIVQHTDEGEVVLEVIDVFTAPGGGTVYKIDMSYPGRIYQEGMFRERRGNTYYETGSWTTDPAAQPQELWYGDQELELLTNPVDLGQTVFGGQQVVAKGSTSVPTGTFEAFEFLFYSETEEEEHVETVERGYLNTMGFRVWEPFS